MTIVDTKELTMTVDVAQTTIVMHEGVAYSYWDEGCTRYVFVNKDETQVVKIEKHRYSTENEKEAAIYENAAPEDKARMAHTALVRGVVVQEFVEPSKWAGRRLSAAQQLFAGQCRGEVGWRGDTLVCFDLDEYKKY